MIIAEKTARITLAGTNGIGPVRFKKIISTYGTALRYFELARSKAGPVITPEKLASALVYGEENYPALLAQAPDSPPVIYVKGNRKLLANYALVSIVGTRNCSNYGIRFLRRLIKTLTEANIVTVSGLAFGIDAWVHELTLENNGKTIAILPAAINQPIPTSHNGLYNSIIENGLALSEFYEDLPEIHPGIFPRRNRIIAALSKITIVIEAGSKSGALITADMAFDYNRSVYALPGDYSRETSMGANRLIAQNKAQLLFDPEEILNELKIYKSGQTVVNSLNLTNAEAEIIKLLQKAELSADKIAEYGKLTAASLIPILTRLELSGYIKQTDTGTYYLT